MLGLSNILMAQCTTTASVQFDTPKHCVDELAQLFCSTFGGTYLWKCPNGNCPPGFDSTSQSPSFLSFTTDYNGIYSVTATDVNSCVSTAQVMLQYNPKPTVSTGPGGSFCEGTAVDVSAFITNDPNGIYGPYTYLWDNGQTTRALSLIASGGGFGPAPNCFVTNVFGCTGANTNQTFINGIIKPEVNVTATGTVKCEGKTSTLAANLILGTGPLTYEWYFNNKPNGGNQSTFAAGSTGAYKVKVTNSQGCFSFSNTKNITMIPAPIAKITAESPTTFCSGGSVKLYAPSNAGYTYSWKKGSNFISGANANNYTATVAGYYTVKITDANSCTRVSAITPVVINCRVSGQLLDEAEMNDQIKAYPVPAMDIVNIDPSGMKGSGTIDIINELGQSVYKSNVTFDGTTIQQIDLNSFEKGLYIISLRNSESVQKVSIIKE